MADNKKGKRVTLRSVYHALTVPSDAVKDIRQRQNARLAAVISFSLILIFTVFMTNATVSGEPSSLTDIISYIMLVAIYIFSRTRYQSVAIALLMALVPGNTFTNVFLGTTYNVNNTLYFLSIGYGLAAIFLRRRYTTLFTVGMVILLLLTPRLAPEGLITLDQLTVQVTVNVILGVIAIVATTHRDNIEREREMETRRNSAAALSSLTRALEYRHNETAVHTNRAVDLSLELAQRLGIRNPNSLRQIREGAMLHDIGKIAVPDGILLKPGDLTEEEWKVVRLHPQIGYELLEEFEFLQDSLAIPRYHHERWNGSGYPEGLAGEDIPLEARIFAVVDVLDALLEDRPYRKAWPLEKVIEHFNENAGVLYDPMIVDHLLTMIEDLSFQPAIRFDAESPVGSESQPGG